MSCRFPTFDPRVALLVNPPRRAFCQLRAPCSLLPALGIGQHARFIAPSHVVSSRLSPSIYLSTPLTLSVYLRLHPISSRLVALHRSTTPTRSTIDASVSLPLSIYLRLSMNPTLHLSMSPTLSIYLSMSPSIDDLRLGAHPPRHFRLPTCDLRLPTSASGPAANAQQSFRPSMRGAGNGAAHARRREGEGAAHVARKGRICWPGRQAKRIARGSGRGARRSTLAPPLARLS
ncbi:hypothetical protein B0H15DRAFT_168836 [Mycena belliarum]|uniref:Uncharacterized protein n=1 Tax=Mycena belliarum TaxID=1033014 RepID=A0AAD6XSI3_9AGAR|nr:hypothetical protein B0H15DRAFT_168836 [Mycena belliae]